jgi:hypothetical protein
MTVNISHLPILPAGGGGTSSLFRRVLLAYLLVEMDQFGDICKSQRELAARFNRTGQNGVGGHLRGICKAGYLFKAYPSTGALLDTYWLGSRITDSSGEYLYFTQLSRALFGDEGLITVLGVTEALGVGCLNESGTLVLGTIVASCDQIAVSSITCYLKDYVSSRAVLRNLSLLQRQGIIEKIDGVVRLTPLWQEEFMGFLTANDACCSRKNRADARRKAEQHLGVAQIGMFVNGSGFIVTESEAMKLLAANPINANVVKRYLTGKDLVSRVDMQPAR